MRSRIADNTVQFKTLRFDHRGSSRLSEPTSGTAWWKWDPGRHPNRGWFLDRRQTERIHYYRTQSAREVDFIWQDAKGKRHLAQVCESMAAPPDTQRREVAALTEAMQKMKL